MRDPRQSHEVSKPSEEVDGVDRGDGNLDVATSWVGGSRNNRERLDRRWPDSSL